MSEVITEYGEATLKTWLMAQLQNLSEYCGVKQKMNPQQISELSDLIIATYPAYRITEIMLFITQMKSGFYGSFYGVIDPQAVMVALVSFTKTRNEEIARIRTTWERQAKEQADAEQYKNSISREEYERRKALKNE